MKKNQRFVMLLCAALALTIAQTYAVEISGTVRVVSGATITVATTGDSVPNVGDKAEIYFKLAGVEGEVFVATASVVKIQGDSIEVKVEKATGEVAKDQLVRITSEKPQPRASASASPPRSDASASAPLLGRWTREAKDDEPFAALIFKSDGTVLIPSPKKDAAEVHGMMMKGTFAVLESAPKLKFEMKNLQLTLPTGLTEEEEKEFHERQSKEEALRILRETLFFGELEPPSTIWIDAIIPGQPAASPGVRGPRAKVFTKASIGETGTTVSPTPASAAAPSPSIAAAPSLSSPVPNALPPVSPPSSTAPPRRGKLALEDRFDNPKDSLLIEGNKNVNGEREIIANPGSRRNRSYNNAPRDFYAEASVRSTTLEWSCNPGFSFRTLNDDGGTMVTYESILFASGRIGFGSTQNAQGAWDGRALPAGTYADATRNTVIGLEAIGREYRVFVDGKCVTSFTGAEPSKGRGFSLILWNEGQTPCTAYFDNLKIYSASTAAQTSGEKQSKPRKR